LKKTVQRLISFNTKIGNLS